MSNDPLDPPDAREPADAPGTHPPEAGASAPDAALPSSGGVPPAVPGWRRKHPILLAAGILAAVIAAVIVTSLTIDLGPYARTRAEAAASKYLERTTHIGRVRIVLYTGAFEVDDLVIEGLTPTDRPFLTAKTVFVNLPWWTIFSKELIVENVDMNDWQMLVEQFPGRHNFPKISHPSTGPKKERWFKTTVASVIARNGQFTYDDHTVPWSVVCRNLNVHVFKGLDTYRGTAQFSNGTVKIQSYEPFRADMQTRFRIDGGKVELEAINLQSTGASTSVNGYVDFARWPEMLYNVKSRVDFPTQKGIFFKTMHFTVAGHGDFTGTFHFFKGGRELKGGFTSPEARVNAWRFPNVKGSLLWIPSAFRVTDVTTGLYGGSAKFNYTMEPFGNPRKPAQVVWDATYADVDLANLTDFLELQGIRLAGSASGRNRLEWPLGKFAEKRGEGHVVATMPPGMQPMTRQVRADQIATVDPLPPEYGPFNPGLPLGHVPIAGDITYSLDPDWITIASGWTATAKTYVDFTGRTAWAKNSHIPFHVTSLDWLESDRVLAGIMTAFGSPTNAIDIGGRGEFDGTMLEAFSKPRIEGHFAGDRMRAWDTVWGHGVADLVIENSYVDIQKSLIQKEGSAITADGKFSLGYPRRDGGEEINATIRVTNRPLVDLRHAFQLDLYPIDGLTSGEFHIYGNYLGPNGAGRLQIDQGKAYGETFETATSNLLFEGTGVRMDAITIAKSTGTVTGASWVGWDGTYSFEADGEKIPVESLKTVSFPRAPLSGILQFNASGVGVFAAPRYDVKVNIADLFAGDEGIGQVSGHLSLRTDMLTMDMEASSKRLSVSGSGRLSLLPEMDAEMSLRFSDTSLDPYIRFFAPKLSPYTTAVADGTIRVVGELADIDHLSVDAKVDQLKLKLFDYAVSNDGEIDLALDQHVIDVRRFRLTGEGTALEVGGQVDLHNNQISLDASGDANLSILQAFYRGDIRTSGNTSLHAQVRGPLDKPVFSGDATISNGRFRYIPIPNSLQDLNARLAFDAQGIRVVDATATLGGGPVRFDGRIGLKGYQVGDVDLTATGVQMQLQYPEDFQSKVDATLTLRGDPNSMVLGGDVTLRDGSYTKRFEPNVDIFNLASSGGGELPAAAPDTPALPVRFDIKIHAPGTIRLDNNLARIVARAEFTLNGTYDKPVLFGRAEIDHGDILFEGNRYRITRGAVDFRNPSRIEPFFDIQAETSIRALADSRSSSSSADEIYRVSIAISGTLEGRMNFNLNSDPPLPKVDIISLVFGEANATDLENPELRQFRTSAATQSEEQLIKAGLLRVLAGGITGTVGRAVEQTLGVDTVQISPSLGTSSADPLTPTARLIIGKRLSSRAYLTFARALGTTTRDQIIVLEYDLSDRFGWVLTQNSSQTFAIDFRVRRTF